MGRYTGPKQKYLKRFKLIEEEVVQGRGRGPRRVRPPKKSAYGLRLEEKQKLRFIYGLYEKQFRKYFNESLKKTGNTEENFMQKLELRLDNVVFRIGLAKTRHQARQMVTHGHILVDNTKVDIPSYQLSLGQTVTVKPKSLDLPFVKENLSESSANSLIPEWLQRKGPVGKVSQLPTLANVNLEVDVPLIIEYYSR